MFERVVQSLTVSPDRDIRNTAPKNSNKGTCAFRVGGCAGSAAGAQEGGTLMDGRPVVADLLGNAPEWQERALCSQTDPEAFFPEKGGSTREAKRICSRCEVRGDCLEYALGHDERFGIWGGLSERERRKLKRRAA
jgi:WhiB family transcriptional regulator, redox-sensing transcriptional regulator